MAESELMNYAVKFQNNYFELIEEKEYDVLQFDQLKYFPEILSYFIRSEHQVKELEKLIVRRNHLWFRVVFVNFSVNGEMFCCPVISVRESHDKIVFYDLTCCKYEDWEDFLANNELPECVMVFPKDGVYRKENEILQLDKKESPACSLLCKISKWAYYGFKIAGIFALFAADCKSLQPYNKAIVAMSALANGCPAGYHGYKLYDRAMRGKSIQYGDPNARVHWNSIKNGIVLFSVTMGQIKYGTPQSDEVVFFNLVKNLEIFSNGGNIDSNLNILQNCVLEVHLLQLSSSAINYFRQNLLTSSINALEVINKTKMLVLKSNLDTEKFRRLVFVDVDELSTVHKGIAFSKEIPRLFQNELSPTDRKMCQVVDMIMKEMKCWLDGIISIRQLVFRVYKACGGPNSFVTIEEMCQHFGVQNPEEIRINNHFIFKRSGKEFLNFFKEHNDENRPELLSYIVEYLKGDNEKDVSGFKKYYHERITKQLIRNTSLGATQSEITWVNAVTYQNLSYTCSIPALGTVLVRPSSGGVKGICTDDLYKLAKKILGRVGDIEMQMVRPEVDWVVVASKKCNFAVIIGPKICVADSGLANECYPVVKKRLS